MVANRVEGTPPLHRLTMLRDDPALHWLSPWSQVKVAAAGLAPLVVWGALMALGMMQAVLPGPGGQSVRHGSPGYVIGLVGTLVLGSLLPTIYWLALNVRSRALLALVRQGVLAEALALDDWSQLADAPDDRPISLVGWVKGRDHLRHRVDGAPCVGLALGCRLRTTQWFESYDRYTGRRDETPYIQRYSQVMETLYDFDLVGDDGRAVPVQVAGARLLGERNVPVMGDDDDEQALVASLDLPPGCRPLVKNTYVLRDGDPVMVVGYRRSFVDARALAPREAPIRVALASAPPQPLLIYPLEAARRPELAGA
jgi:hypothetical protein